MSARIFLFLRPVPSHASLAPYLSWQHLEFARVPSVGEHVCLGNDQYGVRADYVVELVHHTPLRDGDTDAEVYLKRVDFLSIKGELGRSPDDEGRDQWGQDAWPVIREPAARR